MRYKILNSRFADWNYSTAKMLMENSVALVNRPLVIEPDHYGLQANLRDMWSYRELLRILTWRDIKVRYKQTLMGAAWVIVQPLSSMLLFTLVFSRFVGLTVDTLPYPLFAYTGLLLWAYVSNAVINSTNSLISNSNLITKVYFPRVFIPAAAILAGLLDLSIASAVLLGLLFYYRVHLTLHVLLAPVFILLAVGLALALGMLISALTVKYRDLRHALPFTLQFWMFASPVIYSSQAVQGRWRWLILINPLTGILEGFRSTIGEKSFDPISLVISSLFVTGLLVVSFHIFRRTEDTFADVI